MGITVTCIKVGTKYTSEYPNRLFNMVERQGKYDFLCLTDDPTGLNCPTKPIEEDLPGWWSKLTLFRKKAYGLERVLFFDLDVVLTDYIKPLADYEGDFAIIDDWHVPGYNSSVFNLKIGSRRQVWDKFIKDKDRIMNRLHGDQDWITAHAKADLWPADWCTSYKQNPLPTGIVSVFHGEPKPCQCGGWVKELWR